MIEAAAAVSPPSPTGSVLVSAGRSSGGMTPILRSAPDWRVRLLTGKTGLRLVANPGVTTSKTTSTETLHGRVALVTGGGRGIGRAIALGLASAGARVAVLARSTDEVEQTAKLVGERGGDALAVPADITDRGQLTAALEQIDDRWGPVEVLVNNAAVVWPLGASATLDPGEWAAAIDINVTAPARLSFALLPAMLDRGWGRIVNVSSGIAAHPTGMLRANAYATSKAALEAHTLNLAELTRSGITEVTVNVFRPGGVDTAMQAWIRDQNPERIGAELHERFTRNFQDGALLSPEQSASSLLTRLPTTATGQIWDAADPT
jgi:3-oxoacyl-[acyl-carrier protein] reductase